MSNVIFTGQWSVARRILQTSPARIQKALDMATLQEAHYLRKLVVQGMREQAPAGQAFKPLSPLTLALRRFQRFRGTKALLRRGDLRNSINVTQVGAGTAFVGVLRTARNKDGESLANIAELNEYGSRPIVIRITQKMREFLGMVMKNEKGNTGGSGGGGGGGGGQGDSYLVVRIPPRPFFRPIIEKHFKPEEVRMRFLARVGRLLNGDFGQIGITIPDWRDASGGAGAGGSPGPSGAGGAGAPGAPGAKFKDPKRVAAALLGWKRRKGQIRP